MSNLKVYVEEACWNCDEARRLVDWAKETFPAVCIQLVEAETAAEWPASIFAVPTYMLNDQLYSIGNPTRDSLGQTLTILSEELTTGECIPTKS